MPRSAVIHDRTTDANQVYVIENPVGINVAHLRVVLTGESDGGSEIYRVSLSTKAMQKLDHSSCVPTA